MADRAKSELLSTGYFSGTLQVVSQYMDQFDIRHVTAITL